jgi:hypothetical protein
MRRFGPSPAGSLPEVVRTYKAAVTRLLHGQTPIWQRGYHESILHDAAQVTRARRCTNGHAVVTPEINPKLLDTPEGASHTEGA